MRARIWIEFTVSVILGLALWITLVVTGAQWVRKW
mgnify:CR=1 FL=1